jgi:hypothetical protein
MCRSCMPCCMYCQLHISLSCCMYCHVHILLVLLHVLPADWLVLLIALPPADPARPAVVLRTAHRLVLLHVLPCALLRFQLQVLSRHKFMCPTRAAACTAHSSPAISPYSAIARPVAITSPRMCAIW